MIIKNIPITVTLHDIHLRRSADINDRNTFDQTLITTTEDITNSSYLIFNFTCDIAIVGGSDILNVGQVFIPLGNRNV